MKRYSFKDITTCEMCDDKTSEHKILGQRLNQTQGVKPKKKSGISITVQQCNNCGLIYTNPQPIPFDLNDHYGNPPEKYWNEEYFVWSPEYFNTEINVAKRLVCFKEGMKALDIGAGIGKAMISMEKSGFDVYGLEPSTSFYERAISKMKISEQKLKLGSIEELDYENNHFDFITFGAVFEHLYEPSKCLKKAMDWLKPNGVIHIEVPSSKWLLPKFINLYYRFIGTNYVTNLSPMHPPFHLYEFDLRSFDKLSKKLNFQIELFNYNVCSIYYVPKILHSILRAYMKATNKGMQLTVYLRKI